MPRRRPFVVLVEWPNGKRVTLGFRDFNRAERYAKNAARRGARSAVAVPSSTAIPTPARIPDRSGAPIGSPGARGPYFPGVADFPIILLTADGAESFGGMARFTGAMPGGNVATDSIWDAKGDLAAATGPDAATRLAVGANGLVLTADSTQANGMKWASASAIGSSALVYRYTVTGSDKASIDTGVDAPDAGSNDWTNGDLLEIFFYSRTDEAVEISQCNCLLNNDSAGHYDVYRLLGNNGAASAASSLGRVNFFFDSMGASSAANTFATMRATFQNYGGTVGFKSGELSHHAPSEVAASGEIALWSIGFRSTSAITRFSVAPNTAGKKFKVGSQLLIYKRTSA